MALYLVDRNLDGMTQEQLVERHKLAIKVSQRFSEEGRPVRYLHTIYIPSEAHCLSLFESSSAINVQDVNEAAQIAFTKIVQVYDLVP